VISDSANTGKQKIGISKNKKKEVHIMSLQITNIKHMWLPFFRIKIVVTNIMKK